MNPIHRILLILLSVILTRCSLPGGGIPHLAWVSLVPFFLALRGLSHRKQAGLGLIYGFAFWYSSLWWMPQGLAHWGRLPVFTGVMLTVAFCVYHALPYALFGYRGKLLADDEGMVGLVRDAAVLTALLSIYPTVFPGHIAIALYQSPLFIQTADLGGVPLVLFFVLLINRCAADLIRRGAARINPISPLAVICAVMAFVTVYGGNRLAQMRTEASDAEKREMIRIAAIQPDIPTRLAEGNQEAAVLSAIAAAEMELRKHSAVDLVVWPEMPVFLWCNSASLRQFGLIRHAVTVGSPVLVNCLDTGAEMRKESDKPSHESNTRSIFIEKQNERSVSAEAIRGPDPANPGKFFLHPAALVNSYNGAVMIDGLGAPGAAYHKQLLLPFVEYLPFERELPILRRLFPAASVYVRGKEATVMDMGNGRRLIPLLCYEAIFTGPVRKAVENGGNVLMNMADDAWFGKSDESEFHLSFIPFRAVEFRIPLVRVNNAGISAFADATGTILAGTKTGLFEHTVIVKDLVISKNRSLYFHIGDAFLYTLILLLLVDGLKGKRWVKVPSGTVSL
jgi:apolipoprotein N-acyltransferase